MSVSWFEYTKKFQKNLREQPVVEDKKNKVNTTGSKNESFRYVLIL